MHGNTEGIFILIGFKNWACKRLMFIVFNRNTEFFGVKMAELTLSDKTISFEVFPHEMGLFSTSLELNVKFGDQNLNT